MTTEWRHNWDHKPECTENECYCFDPENPDPVCECGRPGWACSCYEIGGEGGEGS